MKIIRQFLFVIIAIIGFSIAASAQSQDGKKDPPPKPPLQIPVAPKGNPPPKPKDDDNKKPTAYLPEFLENKPILYV